ncbi:MAG TPA: hypothetical protein VNH11_29690 [Pirellulales bacterium]|nr:hypothetical protein [Pirellulales bacterium]HVC96627.1 hypothetical protein [Pirellulales bacterium]
MERCLHNVSDLSADARSAVEAIVGHPLSGGDVLYIAALGVKTEPAAAEQCAAWDELESIIGQMQQHAAQAGLSPEQIDEVIDSESAAVRYGLGR